MQYIQRLLHTYDIPTIVSLVKPVASQTATICSATAYTKS